MVLLFLAALLLVPQAAHAQAVATSFDQLQRLLEPGDTIFVTGTNGRTNRGRLGELTGDSLELLTPKIASDGRETLVPQSRLAAADVTEIRVQRRDSLLNGALIGLGIAAAPWLIVQALSGGYGEPGGEHLFLWVALYTGATGAGIGTAVDALMTQKVMVFYRPQRRAAMTLSVRF